MCLLIAAFLVVGCAAVNTSNILSHHAVLKINQGGYGSATCVGRGLVLTSTHVLFDENGQYKGGVLFFGEKSDSNFSVILSREEVTLLRSRVAFSIFSVKIDFPEVGRDVFWVQPFGFQDGMYFVLIKGIVSGFVPPFNYLLDRSIWQGASGSGVYGLDGKLKGIIFGRLTFKKHFEFVSFGMVNPIPREIRLLIEKNQESDPFKSAIPDGVSSAVTPPA